MVDSNRIERTGSGALILLVGGAVAIYSLVNLRTGSLSSPGPGGFPLLLGLFLVAIGLVSMVLAISRRSPAGPAVEVPGEAADHQEEPIDPMAIVFVVLSLALFAILIELFGMAPAIFGQVLVSASIGSKISWPVRLALASGAAAAAAIMFSVLLSVPVPVFNWPFGG